MTLLRASLHDIMHTPMQSNPSSHLDLVDYACQDLMASFAVANNKAGLSNFSAVTNVTVDIGGTYYV